jgi:hypothetical protein
MSMLRRKVEHELDALDNRSMAAVYAKSFQRSLNMKMSRWFKYEKQGCF